MSTCIEPLVERTNLPLSLSEFIVVIVFFHFLPDLAANRPEWCLQQALPPGNRNLKHRDRLTTLRGSPKELYWRARRNILDAEEEWEWEENKKKVRGRYQLHSTAP